MMSKVIVKEAIKESKCTKKGTANMLKAYSIISGMRNENLSWVKIARILDCGYNAAEIQNFIEVAKYFMNNPII